MNPPEVETLYGRVRGSTQDGVDAFLGIPYAAPPIGPRRFAPPEPPPSWDGVRDCVETGPLAPQTRVEFPGMDVSVLFGPVWREEDGGDYLTLNVLKPHGAATGLPVMVWIHGGGFVYGSKDIPICDGTAFARDGVVFVAINYRLGIEGFLPIPGVPTNLGLRDQIAALKWVRDNISAFGGDPGAVTLFGESAGGICVSCLLASPLAEGLFRRAIVQSGHALFRTSPTIALKVVRQLARGLGVTPDVEGFRTVSSRDVIAAQTRVEKARLDLRDDRGVDFTLGISRFMPVCGDDVLPQPPEALLRNGHGAAVDLLIGTTTEEMNMFFVPTGAKKKINALVALYLLSRGFPKALRALRAYGLGRRGVSAGEAMARAATDLVFREPARRFAAAHRGRTHFWEFGWRSPAFHGELGAAHSVENPFIFDTLAVSGLVVGDDPPQAMADSIHKVWLDYAAGGAAPWTEFSADAYWVLALETRTATLQAPLPSAALLP